MLTQVTLLAQLSLLVGKPLAAKKSKRTQDARDTYRAIQLGMEPRIALTELLHKLKGKNYKAERDALKKLRDDVPAPPLRLKFPYPLIPWETK